MSISRSLLVSSLIAFAIFQFYQVHSSFVTVFVDYRHHYSNEIKVLTVFNIVGLTISSTLLIVGAIKSKANLLLLALIYLFYKVGFFFWYLRDFYNITIGCEGFCDSNRLWVAYQHIAVFAFLLLTITLTINLIVVLKRDSSEKKKVSTMEQQYQISSPIGEN